MLNGFARSFFSKVILLSMMGVLATPLSARTLYPDLDKQREASPDTRDPAASQPDLSVLLQSATGIFALRTYAQEDYGAAENAIRSYIAKNPDVADAWYLLGLILAKSEKTDESIEALAKAADMYTANAGPLVVMGDLLWSTDRREDAKKAYLKASERDPVDWRAQESLGIMAEQEKDIEEALRRYELALVALPRDAFRTRQRLSQLYRRMGDPEKSVEVLEPYVAGHPDDTDALVALGRAQLDAGEFAGAAESLTAALKADANDVKVLLSLAMARFELGDTDAAFEAIAQAEELAPASADAAFIRGNLERAAGAPEKAVLSYRKAMELSGNPVAAASYLARAQIATGDTEGALETLTSAAASETDAPADVWLALGELHAALGDLKSAEAAYVRLTEVYPRSTIGRLRLASAKAAQARYAEALSDFEAGLDLAPSNAPLLRGAALSAARVGDMDRAVAYGERLAAATSDSAGSLMLLGWLEDSSGDAAAAEAVYRKIVAADPEHGGALNNLSVLLTKRGETAEAVVLAERATIALPDAAYAWDTASSAYLADGQADKAVAASERAVQLDPDNAKYVLDLGRSQIETGDVAAGKETVRQSLDMGLPEAMAEDARALLEDR